MVMMKNITSKKNCAYVFKYFRYANLFLNLFGLMVDACIPDIALEPDKAVKKVIRFPRLLLRTF